MAREINRRDGTRSIAACKKDARFMQGGILAWSWIREPGEHASLRRPRHAARRFIPAT